MIFPSNATTTQIRGNTGTGLTSTSTVLMPDDSSSRVIYGFQLSSNRFTTDLSLKCGNESIYSSEGATGIGPQVLVKFSCSNQVNLVSTAAAQPATITGSITYSTTSQSMVNPEEQFYSEVCNSSLTVCYDPLKAQFGLYLGVVFLFLCVIFGIYIYRRI